MTRFPYGEIEKKLGYRFSNKQLLKDAFTHSTYAHLHGGNDNERLEYLGDAVLELIVSEWQYTGEPTATAGQMTAKRQKIVCRAALDSATDGLGIWKYLLYEGTLENLRGKPKSSLFEAVTAAVYLDGGYEAARAFVLGHGNLRSVADTENYIGELKEYLEKRGQDQPKEEMVQSGKANAPVFRCMLTALGESAEGEGRTKREARAMASARLLWELENKK